MARSKKDAFSAEMKTSSTGEEAKPEDETSPCVPGQTETETETETSTAGGLTPEHRDREGDEHRDREGGEQRDRPGGEQRDRPGGEQRDRPGGEQRDRPGGEQRALVSDFKQMKLEKDAQKNWDLFYKRNTTNFFKDRHWTTREFEELKACREFQSQRLVLLEAGCGVGNCIFPLLEDDLSIFVYACDFSPRAVEFVKQNRLYCPERCCAFQCDLTTDDLRDNVPEGGVDVITLIFVLSAVHPDKMKLALQNISRVLKPGGVVLFRDYGLHDHAMLRFKAGSKLGENFYVRQDGTRSFFFSKEFLAELFEDAGFLCVANDYVLRETVNKKEGLCVPRVFLQSKFTKPDPSASS